MTIAVDWDVKNQTKQNLWLLGSFFMLFCRLLIFFKIIFLKNSFRNIIRVLNSLDPDQARHFVGPDLDPDCLQMLSAI